MKQKPYGLSNCNLQLGGNGCSAAGAGPEDALLKCGRKGRIEFFGQSGSCLAALIWRSPGRARFSCNEVVEYCRHRTCHPKQHYHMPRSSVLSQEENLSKPPKKGIVPWRVRRWMFQSSMKPELAKPRCDIPSETKVCWGYACPATFLLGF